MDSCSYAMLCCSLPYLSFLFQYEFLVRTSFHRFAAAEARATCLTSPLDMMEVDGKVREPNFGPVLIPDNYIF